MVNKTFVFVLVGVFLIVSTAFAASGGGSGSGSSAGGGKGGSSGGSKGGSGKSGSSLGNGGKTGSSIGGDAWEKYKPKDKGGDDGDDGGGPDGPKKSDDFDQDSVKPPKIDAGGGKGGSSGGDSGGNNEKAQKTPVVDEDEEETEGGFLQFKDFVWEQFDPNIFYDNLISSPSHVGKILMTQACEDYTAQKHPFELRRTMLPGVGWNVGTAQDLAKGGGGLAPIEQPDRYIKGVCQDIAGFMSVSMGKASMSTVSKKYGVGITNSMSLANYCFSSFNFYSYMPREAYLKLLRVYVQQFPEYSKMQIRPFLFLYANQYFTQNCGKYQYYRASVIPMVMDAAYPARISKRTKTFNDLYAFLLVGKTDDAAQLLIKAVPAAEVQEIDKKVKKFCRGLRREKVEVRDIFK